MIFGRYLSREFLKLNTLIAIFFLMMFCLIDFMEQNTRYFPKYHATPAVIFEFYLTQLPKMFVDMLPFSSMFAAIITLWIFAKSGEISALRAAGRSVLRTCFPIVFSGLCLALLSMLLSELVIPRTALHFKKVETVKIEKSELGKMFLESNWVKGDSAILHFRDLNQVQKSLEKAEYFLFRTPSEIREFVFATRALFDAKKGVWVLHEAQVSEFDSQGKLLGRRYAATYPTVVSSQPPKLLNEGVTSDQISYSDLRELIAQSKEAGGAAADREVDLYQKLAAPFANLVFVLFALPFALRRERQADTYIGIVLCLGAGVLYWVGNLSLRSMAQNGLVNPMLAAWTTTVVLGMLSFYLVHKLDRGQ